MRPISSAVRMRIADRIQRQTNCSAAEAVVKATAVIHFIDACGLDLVMPGWVPIDGDAPEARKKTFRWEDLAGNLSELEDRAPWKPYDA